MKTKFNRNKKIVGPQNASSLKKASARAKKAAAVKTTTTNNATYKPTKEELKFVPKSLHQYCRLTEQQVDALCAVFQQTFDFTKSYALVDYQIDRDLAEALLRRYNSANRKASAAQIKIYADRMTNGVWLDNGPRVVFSVSESLLNSQHSLGAIVKSGLTQKVLVQTGVRDQFAHILDNDKSRNTKDAAVILLKQDQQQIGQSTVLTKEQEASLKASSDIATKLVSGLHPNSSSRTMTPFDKSQIGNQHVSLFYKIHLLVSQIVEGLNSDTMKAQQVQLEAGIAWHAINNNSRNCAAVIKLLEDLVVDPSRRSEKAIGGSATPWKKFISWHKNARRIDRVSTGRMYSMVLETIHLELKGGAKIKKLVGWTSESQFNSKNNFVDLWKPQYPLPNNWRDYLSE